jgi:hypothetical protein
VSVRKGPWPALAVVDECSALSGGREAATHIMERGRSFGVPSILSGQSYASLGSPEEADRIVSAAATIALFASNTPEDLARLAGSVQTAEAVYQVENGRWNGRASLTSRARHRVDPNSVRQLQPGQCVPVSGAAPKAPGDPGPQGQQRPCATAPAVRGHQSGATSEPPASRVRACGAASRP